MQEVTAINKYLGDDYSKTDYWKQNSDKKHFHLFIFVLYKNVGCRLKIKILHSFQV